jgi:hypothetical protein
MREIKGFAKREKFNNESKFFAKEGFCYEKERSC